MKTAKEILEKHIGINIAPNFGDGKQEIYVIKAMEEYANQPKTSEALVKESGEYFERNKKLITNFLDWYYEEGLKTPMRFETDHDDIAMMFLTEGNY